MQHALGLAGRSAGVENEQRIFRIHWLGRTIGIDPFAQVVPPPIAALLEIDLGRRPLYDDNRFDPARLCTGRVDIGL